MKKIIIFISILFFPFFINAKELKIDFEKTFGGLDSDQFVSNDIDSEQNTVHVGTISSLDIDGLEHKGNLDGLIVKYDKNGNLVWKRSFGGSAYDYFYSVAVLQDDSYVAVGYTSSPEIEGLTSKGGNDCIIVKYDKDGNIIWKKILGGSDYDWIHAVSSTSDNGFVVIGEFNSNDFENLVSNGDNDAFIAKYDKDGNVEWIKNWGGSDSDFFYTVNSINNEILVTGGFYSIDIEGISLSGTEGIVLIKYDLDGNVIWTKSREGNSGDLIYSAKLAGDGFYAVGRTSVQLTRGTSNRNRFGGMVLKYDSEGNLIWEKSIGLELNTQFKDLEVAKDNGIYVVGLANGLEYEGVTVKGESDAYLIKYDSSGNISWMKNWGGSGNDMFNAISISDDNSLLVSGSVASTDIDGVTVSGLYDTILVRYFTEYKLENVEVTNGSSTVIQNGVPITSCLLYLLPILAASSYVVINSLLNFSYISIAFSL